MACTIPFAIKLKEQGKICFLIVIMLFTVVRLSGQFTLMGEDPPGIVWRQIKTDKFRLVYDRNFEEEAQRAAAILDYSLNLTGNTLNQKHRKLKILLHNHTTVSNGFVTLAPARMEWYSVPPQDMYGQDWFEQLAIHEGRHWHQINRINRNNVLFLRYLFGESGWSLGVAQAHPWFLEGDAVVTETALSTTGRGRLPSFEMGFRTIQLTFHRPYPFRKSVFGAYDDYVPNHYELGYLLVAYNRLKYGPELWENVLNEIAFNPFIAPFNISLKKQTGLNREKLYLQTFYELDSLWQSKVKGLQYTQYSVVYPIPTTSYTAYRSPQKYEGKIIALKTGLDHAPQIVIIDPSKAKESLLVRTGALASDRITLSQGIIYYDEYQPHVRWGNLVYSEIRAYNLKTGLLYSLTRQTRYFAPAISPSGKQLVVVENDISGKNYLTFLNPNNGSIIKRIPSPNNASLQLPSWSADETKIVCTQVDTSGKSLVWFNLTDSSWQILHRNTKYDISYPQFSKQYIIFRGSYSGIDNIYALDTITRNIYQLTSARFGAFDPCADTSFANLLYCNYDFRGYELVTTPFKKLAWTPLPEVKDVSLHLAEALQQQEPEKFDRNKIEYKHYESQPYRKWSHLINIHSWLPFYPYTPKNSMMAPKIFPGYYVMSQNLLGTLTVVGGQGYYKKNLYNQLELNYTGHFPAFQLGIQQGDSIQYINTTNLNTREKELKVYTGLSFPLNFSSGSTLISFVPGATYEYTNTYFRTSQNSIDQGRNTLYLNLRWVAYRRMALRDFVPRMGMVWDAIVAKPLTGTDYFSSQLSTRLSVFFPGFQEHHAFNFIIAYENQNIRPYLFSTRMDPPRGYVQTWDSIKPYLKGVQQYSLDYYFPLSYSGFTLLKVFYFKLFAGSIFASMASTEEYQTQYRNFERHYYPSIGYQVFTDFHLFFFPVTIRFGYNYSMALQKNKTIVEPYLRINYSF